MPATAGAEYNDSVLMRRILLIVVLLVGCRHAEPPAAKAAPAFRNLLLITIDTLRADALPMYGGKTPTPFLESFARNAAVFQHAYTPAPITLPAHTSLMSGLYPPSHGVRNNGTFRAPQSLHLLAEYAKQHEMRTGAVIGGFPLAAEFGLNQGFDFYDDSFPPQSVDPGVFLYTEKTAEEVRRSAESWLARSQSPYFLWLHFFDPHHPYREHGFSGLEPYQQEIAYVDQQLGLFFEFLKSHRLDEQTLVLVTSDHGEAFGEHGEVSHSLFLYNTTLHIPFMISGAGITAGRHQELARLIDFAPTVMEAFGWKADNAFDGASFLPELHGAPGTTRDNYAETFAPAFDFGWSPLASMQDLRYKYIRAPRPEFYDLQNDPGETQSLPASKAPADYAAKITQILKQSAMPGAAHSPTPEEREKLASLGYLNGGSARANWNAPDPKDRVAVARTLAELAAAPMALSRKAKAYAEIARSEPSNPLLLLRYGEVLLKLQKYLDAQKVFQQVMDLEYPSPSVYNGMAAALFYQRKASDAEAILKQAVKVGAADGETHYNLAEFLFNEANRTGAMQEYDRSMALGYAPAYYRKARILDLMAQQEQAMKLLKDAEARFPADMNANFDQGMIYFRRHDFSLAAAQFEKALKKAPEETGIYYNLGISYLRMGNDRAGRDYLERFVREAPASMSQQKAEARALLKQS